MICGVQSWASRRRLAALLARELDRFLEQVVVELEADLADVAGLLVAEQVAGTPDVEVVGGELEAGAELVEALDHLQAALGDLAQASAWAAA